MTDSDSELMLMFAKSGLDLFSISILQAIEMSGPV